MKKALIVIDVQNGFINKKTSLLPQKIADLIAKRKFDGIVFTKFVNKKGSNYFKILNWRNMQRSPDTDIHPALASLVKKYGVFQKMTYSVFGNKSLQPFLKRKKITRVYLCGIDIDACVLATAFDAFDLGYKVTVLSEYSKSQGGKNYDRAAQKILGRNIQLT
jgi:nicotinamidase-related amidase